MSGLAAPAGPAGATAGLLRLLRDYRIEGFERSFKMTEGSLLGDRFLLGIHKADISPPALFSLCARMGMPEPHLVALKENAEAANVFHFGFESKEGGGIAKVYLEFAPAMPSAHERSSQAPGRVLLHLAFKWDPVDPARRTIARYECFPGLSSAGMLARLTSLYVGREDRGVIATMREIIGLAEDRSGRAPMYLEVGEAGNPRASFDVNLHDARIGIREIAPWLARMRERFAIPAAQFGAACAGAGNATLGHLSGGVSRDGHDFVTVYYAAEPP